MGPSKYELHLKLVRARSNHECAKCGAVIAAKEMYYRESAEDRFLQSLHARAFCQKCYDIEGTALLHWRKQRSKEDSRDLSEFLR